MVFSGPIYYPMGGVQDFTGRFDTREEAEAKARSIVEANPYRWANFGRFDGKKFVDVCLVIDHGRGVEVEDDEQVRR
jgi:hypothetical protein